MSLLESAITDKTKAIMPVGIYGQTSDMKEICGIAERQGSIPIIEDAAHPSAHITEKVMRSF